MPSSSIGFCVASTMNSSGSGYITPPIDVWRSCIASNIALCVLALERLISSRRTKLACTGPSRVSNVAVVRVVDLGADDVARQQVGRALDADERGADRTGERRRRRRLGQPGHALEQDVALGEQRDEQARAQPFLADERSS